MSVIAVINRKGGAGKSTLATHIAGFLASLGHDVMLGDVDKQQSSRMWLGLRPISTPRIHGWTMDERNFARPPVGVKHVVLDTPGGFQGVGLMKVALYADAILIPATTSIFDRTAAEDSIKELRTFPRVASGKCILACIGMRIDGRTRNAEVLQAWSESLALPYLGTIKAAQVYSKCLEQGLCIFDFAPDKMETYLSEWQPVTQWLSALLAFAPPEPKISRPVDLSEAPGMPEFLRR
ncbi:MAG: chromosome partitioning protein [Rhodocyclales bacterium]|nr:chromosome partitioning protein [Rhodocyclales bacterium]